MHIYKNILATIGRTPVVRINKLGPKGVDMFVKVESFNPAGSVKDRLAIAVIEDAERSGALKPGQTIVEATSGNTGVALAMVCAAKGYPFVATMAESFSIERRKLMKAYGAKVVLTPKEERGTGMVRKAEELAAKNGWFLTRQFQNFANPAYHRNTTGPEIIQDFVGKRLDYWVTGWGTGGTMSGAGDIIKKARPETKIVMAEPENAALVSGDQWNAHKIQGWAPDFVPEVLDKSIADEIILVNEDKSIDTANQLAQQEGILCGTSSGATFAAALKIAETAEEGTSILAMLPDTGERYLSAAQFAHISEGSDEV